MVFDQWTFLFCCGRNIRFYGAMGGALGAGLLEVDVLKITKDGLPYTPNWGSNGLSSPKLIDLEASMSKTIK